jgi:primosomal protein N' (replication factor Y)
VRGPFFDLVFDLPVNRRFTYRGDAKGMAAPGKRALAPFGRRDLLGYILAEKADPPPGVGEEALKPLKRVVDREPVFDEEDVDLAEWMGDFYFCSPGPWRR